MLDDENYLVDLNYNKYSLDHLVLRYVGKYGILVEERKQDLTPNRVIEVFVDDKFRRKKLILNVFDNFLTMIGLLVALSFSYNLENLKAVGAPVPRLGWTDDELHELVDAVITVLFEKGRVLTEINNISDAIIHSRSGAGGDLPAGPGLYHEMDDFDNYQAVFNGTGKIIQKLQEQVREAAKNSDSGVIVNTQNYYYLLQCITLGHYSVFPKYEIPYSCVTEGGVKKCTVTQGEVISSGVDCWDFESQKDWSWLRNLIFEKIPEWLVKIHGKHMKPFNTHYTIKTNYTFTIDV